MPNALGRSYTYWYAPPLDGGHQFADQFSGRVQDLGDFTNVEQFWSYYCHLIRPSDLQLNSSYYVFRTGVSPMWEDPVNQSGGRLLARIPKALSSRCWENLVLALIGEQLSGSVASAGGEDDTFNFICGIGVTTKKAHDVLSVWHSEDSRRLADRLREAAQRALALPVMIQWEYRKNADSAMMSGHSGGGNNQIQAVSPNSYPSSLQNPGGVDYSGGHHHGSSRGGGHHGGYHHHHSHHQHHHQQQHNQQGANNYNSNRMPTMPYS